MLEIIRKDTDYAFRALAAIALSGSRPLTTAMISHRQDIPRRFAEKILRRLVAGGILRGRSGKHGGFTLARTLGSVRMLDVVEAVQGPVTVNHCTGRPPNCPRRKHCPVRPRWRQLQDQVVDFLGQPTLADILGYVSPEGSETGDSSPATPAARTQRSKHA